MLAKGAAAPKTQCSLGQRSQRLAHTTAPVAGAPWRGPSAGPSSSARGRRLTAAPSSGGSGVEVQVVEETLVADVVPADVDASANAAQEVIDAEVHVDITESTEVAGDGFEAAVGFNQPPQLQQELEVQVAEAGPSAAVTLAVAPPADPLETAVAAALSQREAPSSAAAATATATAAVAAAAAPDSSAATTTTAATAATPTETAPGPAALRRAPVVDLPLAALLRQAPDSSSSAAAGGGPAAAAPPPPRPFPPPLDLTALQQALLGEPTIGPVFANLFAAAAAARGRLPSPHTATSDSDSRDGAASGDGGASTSGDGGGGPLLYAPRFPRPAGSPPAASLPLLVYLPGIDGTGLAAYRQFPRLAARFDLRAVFLPPGDRTPFAGLVAELAEQIEDECAGLDPSRPVYLLGESFGGILALALAQKLSCVDRVVLVNPATSFDRSPWPALGPLLPALPPDAYRLLPVALSPLLSNPWAMAAHAIGSPADPPQRQAVDLLYGLLELIPEMSALRVVLPPDTLRWRLELLAQGAREVNPTLKQVRQRVLLLAGERDLVIPSAAEVGRLAQQLPRATPRTLAGRSHALLQEAGVDLVGLMQEEDFYISRRRLTRPNAPPRPRGTSSTSTSAASTTASLSPGARPRPAPGGAAFGTPGPLELPTPGEIRRAAREGGLDTLRALVSPVFLSTDGPTGRVQLGLGGLPPPTRGSGPVLFVGNHQLFAPDMPLMVEHFLVERGQMLRGLAHPMALGAGQASPDARSSGRFGRFLETFGAVPVGGRALHTLLAGGEAVLLYPGGVREALKLRDERYALIWPRRPEFVRMACKFGATIVPFAAVGAEDGVEMLADRRDLLATPLVGDWLRQQNSKSVLARRGVSASEEIEESFVPPLVGPKLPSRFYFLFGAPLATDPRVADDRATVDELYGRVRAGVEGCLGYLLRKRESDPYKDLLPRLAYEASWGGRRQAPTFKP